MSAVNQVSLSKTGALGSRSLIQQQKSHPSRACLSKSELGISEAFGIFLSHSDGGAFSCVFCSLLALSTTEIRTSTDI